MATTSISNGNSQSVAYQTVLQDYDSKSLSGDERVLYGEAHALWQAYAEAKAKGVLTTPSATFSFSYAAETFTCTASSLDYTQDGQYRGLVMTGNNLLNYQEFSCASSLGGSANFLIGNVDTTWGVPVHMDESAVFSVLRAE